MQLHARSMVFLLETGIDPRELLRIGREQLDRYDTVRVKDIGVTSIEQDHEQFAVTLTDMTQLSARKVLFATGVVDQLPDVEAFEKFYGRGIFHCPYCDGWEVRDQPIAVYGHGEQGPGLARAIIESCGSMTA